MVRWHHWLMSLSKLQEIVKDRESCHAAVHKVAKRQTWLSDWTTATMHLKTRNTKLYPVRNHLNLSNTSPFIICSMCLKCSFGSVMSDYLWPYGLQPIRLLCLWDYPRKNTRVGCHALPQGIFLTQGSNPHLPHCWQIHYPWVMGESPIICSSFSK